MHLNADMLAGFKARLYITLAVFFFFVLSFFSYLEAEQAIVRAHQQRLQSFFLADELRQSSDDLTRMVRTYAVTGDTRYKDQFNEIFAIRNGEAPRPEEHHRIYWDFVLDAQQRPRASGQAVPLLTLMEQAGFTEEEFAALRSAKKASDDLTTIEQQAMALVATADPQLREQALTMLHDNAYHQAKFGIMAPIDTLYAMVDARTQETVNRAEQNVHRLRGVFVVMGLLLLGLMYSIKRQELAVLGTTVTDLYEKIESLGDIDASPAITVASNRQNTVLARLAQTQQRLRKLEYSRRQALEKLEHIAHFDALTGLANRFLFAQRLRLAMSTAGQQHTHIAVAFIDLDGFKAINDTHGHKVGDKVLITVARRLFDAVREIDTVARFGGDEFVLLVSDLIEGDDSRLMFERIIQLLSLPFEVEGKQLFLSASIGISLYPQGRDVDADQLLRQADQAMYAAKQAGKNRFHYFDEHADQQLRGIHQQLDQIQHALHESQFRLFFQPQIDLRTGQCLGMEALVRWQHPQQGLLSPSHFLPWIEHHPLGVALGRWVMQQALAQLRDWRAQGITMVVSVNISANHIQDVDFVDELSALLRRFNDVDPQQLELEIVETSALHDVSHVLATMEACCALGVSFALDDFGTGYSSLSYLKRLPVNKLKVDQSFVRDMLVDEDDRIILHGIQQLAHAFHLVLVAEGVETDAHQQALLEMGYTLGQGYGIAMPMPAEEVSQWWYAHSGVSKGFNRA